MRPVAERAEIMEHVRCATGLSSTILIGTTLGGGLDNFSDMSFSMIGVGPCQDLAKNVGVRLEWERYSCFRGVYHHGLNW